MNEQNPWEGIPNAGTRSSFSARKVNRDNNPCGIPVYWAVDLSGRMALLVEYSLASWYPARLPEFENIELQDSEEDNSIAIILLNSQMRDMFLGICLDVISYLQDLPDMQRRESMLLRLERWSLLLKPSRSKLSPEAQKGLIAELRFLKHDALSACGENIAIKGWTGPDAGPRDFAYGQVFIEVKSKRGSANTKIVISSEEQLNVNPSEQLFLYVLELNDAALDRQDAFTITDVVEETRDAIASPLQRAALDGKLANVGFFDEDDYSDQKWSEGSSYYYAVIDGFPKIDSRSCTPGVSRVTYQIDLDYCDDFRVERDKVIDAME